MPRSSSLLSSLTQGLFSLDSSAVGRRRDTGEPYVVVPRESLTTEDVEDILLDENDDPLTV